MNVLFAMIPAFFWGTTYAVTQYTLADWPPLLLGALRALPAGLILLAVKPTFPKKENWKPLITIGIVNIAAFFSLIFVMALTLPSAISGVGMISVPVFAMAFHWIFNRTAPSIVQLASGILLVMLAWLLFDPKSIVLSSIGLIAMLAAISCIIFGSSLTKTLGGKIDWWTVLTWQMLVGGIALTLVVLCHVAINPQPYFDVVSSVNTKNLIGLAWITILNTAFSYSLYVWLLQRMSIVDFTFGSIANPIAGIVCGGLLMNELYSIHQYSLMGGMIVVSLLPQLLVTVMKKRRPTQLTLQNK
ncbi:DMT family transporter [Vibrio ziniensis]|uniref:EamA family transporter n=1 Tax=Vibrio ziniensis TaxID=2711221 RepID=A0A6G7CNZ3_9VIBR|nr:EamA family transporter [Vibrio ziniensis]QIH43857.1 EamA family transporter [Vibrio ziniensis]